MRFLLISFFIGLYLTSIAQKDDTTVKSGDFGQLKTAWYLTSLTDSQFVANNSESEAVLHYYHTGTFPPNTEHDFIMARKGFIIGPYDNGNARSIYKKVGKAKTCDSVQVSHILYSYAGAVGGSPDVSRTKQQAKKSADSLCALINKGKVLLEDVVEQVTDDPGSKSGNKGNYGWFTRESGFVGPFVRAAFRNKVGETVVTETDFGYHIIQVEAKTKEFDCIMAWEIVRSIDTCYLLNGLAKVIAPPGYDGGGVEFRRIVKVKHTEYDSLKLPMYDSLVVNLMVTVDADSLVTDVLVIADFLSEAAKQDLVILIKSMPGWIPARTCEGTIPATIYLSAEL